eukprot:Tamp_15660.p2 GENE.Tamp_15660~~Tamp_15660.p2  ORF type:complete len:192 (+),score=13.65 Tamp_15660:226-801(+)
MRAASNSDMRLTSLMFTSIARAGLGVDDFGVRGIPRSGLAEDARVALAAAAARERDGGPLAATSATAIALAGDAIAVASALAAMAAAGALAPADALAAGARMATSTVSAAAATASDALAACLVIALGDRPSSEDGQNRGNHMAVSRDCKVCRFVGCPREASALRLARAPRHPHPFARVDCVSHVKTSSRHQ